MKKEKLYSRNFEEKVDEPKKKEEFEDVAEVIEQIDSRTKQTKPNKKKILIVDDQLFNINALILILEYCVKIECKVVCKSVKSGKAAIKTIEENIKENIEQNG